jgi:cytochrome c oxidase assembly protein subunit 15
MNFQEAVIPSTEIGPNYEGGKLDNPARVTIHMMHRLGAGMIFVYLLGLSLVIFKSQPAPRTREFAWALIFFLVLQVILGISNILFHLPLGIATAHNAVAALLFLSLLGLISTQQ